jgi:putative hydrolase of the HAD superfamily
MSIRAIVFDFGNVVGFFDHRRTTERLAPHAGIPAEAIHAYLFGGELEDEYESGRLSTAAFLSRIRDYCRLGCPDEFIATAWGDIFWPNAAVSELLPLLRPNYRLLLGSNTNELHARHFCSQFAEVFRNFDALVLSHEVGARKPRAEFFDHCRRLAGCVAADCLFIDDLPANVAGARACGFQGLVYRKDTDLAAQLTALGIRGLENRAGATKKEV